MKLFGNNPIEIINHLKQPIINNEIELEIIFGSSPYKNPIDKKTFLRVLEECNKSYKKLSEAIDLDIRTEYRGKPSNVRCTIHGLDSIKKYCKENTLKDIRSIEFIQKKFNKGFEQLKDENYNVRLNSKIENKLNNSHYFVKTFLQDYEDKKKHYRYKKRFSFITDEKLFRIDLTIIKSTNYYRGKYDFQKSLLLLYNYYDLNQLDDITTGKEGWTKDIGVPAIDRLFKKNSEERELIEPGIYGNGNLYDPLNLGINVEYNYEDEFKEESMYGYPSPRYDDSKNPTLLMRYTDSSIRYTENDYRELIGKATLIKKEYFKENNIDMGVYNTLVEYYKKGNMFAIIQDIFEEVEVDKETQKYIDTKVNVSIYPRIGTYTELTVPLKYIYGGYYDIRETVIESRASKIDLFYEEDERGIGEFVEKADPKKTTKNSKLSETKDQEGGGKNDTLNELSKELLIILEKHILFLSKLVYNTENLISYQLKEDIIVQ